MTDMGALEWFIVGGGALALLCAFLAWAAGRRSAQTSRFDEHYLDGEAAELERRAEAQAPQRAEHRRQRAESPYIDQSKPCPCPDCRRRASVAHDLAHRAQGTGDSGAA